MDQHRPWHDLDCPARDCAVPDSEIASRCTCPPERFLSDAARPVPEPERVP